jgi:hypothetical protein
MAMQPEQVEEMVTIVRSMERESLVDQLVHFKGRFPVDFTSDFLGRQSDDRLRHLFMALCLQQGCVPCEAEPAYA